MRQQNQKERLEKLRMQLKDFVAKYPDSIDAHIIEEKLNFLDWCLHADVISPNGTYQEGYTVWVPDSIDEILAIHKQYLQFNNEIT